MSLVIDASVTVAWSIGAERTEAVSAIFRQVTATGALVPQIWAIEVANALTAAMRRGRMTMTERGEALGVLSDLAIDLDPFTNRRAWSATLAFVDTYRLTAYNAAYLELAKRRSLPLATLDKELIRAAGDLNVPVLP